MGKHLFYLNTFYTLCTNAKFDEYENFNPINNEVHSSLKEDYDFPFFDNLQVTINTKLM